MRTTKKKQLVTKIMLHFTMHGITFRTLFVLTISSVLSVLLYGCQEKDEDVLPDTISSISIRSTSITSQSPEGNSGTGANPDDLLDESSFSSKVSIHFGTTTQIINPLEDSGVSITDSNGHVIIHATVAGIDYELTGNTEAGSIKIYSDKKFKLSLKGVQLTNPTGPAINIQSKKRAFIHLSATTENKLFDGSNHILHPTEDTKGTLFSEGTVLISGKGKLTIGSKYSHAIVSDEYIRIQEGIIYVENAKKDAIHANDAVIMMVAT